MPYISLWDNNCPLQSCGGPERHTDMATAYLRDNFCHIYLYEIIIALFTAVVDQRDILTWRRGYSQLAANTNSIRKPLLFIYTSSQSLPYIVIRLSLTYIERLYVGQIKSGDLCIIVQVGCQGGSCWATNTLFPSWKPTSAGFLISYYIVYYVILLLLCYHIIMYYIILLGNKHIIPLLEANSCWLVDREEATKYCLFLLIFYWEGKPW